MFNDDQIRTLEAAVNRVVPEDDFPGGVEAGCVDFLLRIIELEGLFETYRDGLDGLNAAAGLPFFELSIAEQDGVLDRFDKRFVSLLARQTVEGYYSDPGNGGNRDEVAWRMVGFEVRG